jgi:hypothetical protein
MRFKSLESGMGQYGRSRVGTKTEPFLFREIE